MVTDGRRKPFFFMQRFTFHAPIGLKNRICLPDANLSNGSHGQVLEAKKKFFQKILSKVKIRA